MTDRYQEVLQHPVFQQQAAGVAADAAAATTAGVAAAEGDSPPVGTEPSERAVGVQIVWAVGMCGSWAGPRNPERKQANNNFQQKTTSAHTPSPYSKGQQMGRPVARPVTSMCRFTEVAGRHVQSPYFMDLVMGRAGPGRVVKF